MQLKEALKMDHGKVTRRKFLRGFAALSSAAVLMRFTTGCGNDDGVKYVPVYGPPVVQGGTTKVAGMYSVNAESVQADLHNNTSVPVNSRFKIVFSAAMRSDPIGLDLEDASQKQVQYTQSWSDSFTVEIVPSADLQPATKYKLIVSSALDSSGKALQQNDQAEFTTSS
jgi:hypothetical protein